MNLIFNVSLVNIYRTIKKRKNKMTPGVIITLIIVTGITIETIVNRICTHIERK